MNKAAEQKLLDTVTNLEKTVIEMKKTTDENSHCINGYAGQPGLYQLISQMDSKLDNISKLMNNDFAHLSARVDTMITFFDSKSKETQNYQQASAAKDEEIRKLQLKDTVTWQQVLLEWIKPVIIAIVTAALVYLIVTQNISAK